MEPPARQRTSTHNTHGHVNIHTHTDPSSRAGALKVKVRGLRNTAKQSHDRILAWRQVLCVRPEHLSSSLSRESASSAAMQRCGGHRERLSKERSSLTAVGRRGIGVREGGVCVCGGGSD